MPPTAAETVNCISYFLVKPQYREQCIAALLKLVPQTRMESACLQYEFFQDSQDPNLLVLVEKFINKKGFAEHEAEPYIQKFITNEMNLYCEKVWWHEGHEIIN